MKLFNRIRTNRELRSHNKHLRNLVTLYARELTEKCDNIDKHRAKITIADFTTIDGVEALFPRVMIRSENFTFGVFAKTGAIFPAEDTELAYDPEEIEELIAVLHVALEEQRKLQNKEQ